MIKALVHRYSTDSAVSQSWTAGFIENKGEGRIFLLHGSPGVSKTYWIAEYTNRPLLSLTCGDLGNDETEVEKELSKWFTLAERWGAVMLLDEADVYTEKRMTTDLKRNSMVSVFLRCMDYYKGILFLTTNWVGTFDDAFVSRIHAEQERIWDNFFKKLRNERVDIYVRGGAKKYNGREIRNAFQTAVALADYEFAKAEDKKEGDTPMLTEIHFEKVCDMALQFKEYLNGVNDGLDESQRAALSRARARENYDTDLP
ncbi:P-loop containing nucleoside triphosphate hydrolase protein [Xylariaceae sp. FL0255]|nr:P-loop containing nucleoside triphosphate hydrolase protein [Xylariaceae sp. FL0255]